MENIKKIPWKEKEDKIVSKEDFLNGLPFEDVSDVQQMLYLTYNDISNIDNILDAVCNIKENPPEIPRIDLIESKINEIIDFCVQQGANIEKLPE